MKKSLLAAAVLSAVSFGAYADGVELYGILDVAVGTAAHQFNADSTANATINTTSATYAPQSLTGMFNGGIQGSRWGIKGSEKIDDDLSAVFTLESGIALPSGALSNQLSSIVANNSGTVNNTSASSLNGQLFNRTAWVGLKSNDMGTISFGRQYAVMYDVYTKYDPVQFAGLFTPTGFSGTLGGGGGATELLRQDNSIKYSNMFSGVKFTAMYKFGNVAGSTSNGSAYGFAVDYDNGPFSIAAAYEGATDVLTGGAGGAVATDGTSKGTVTSGYVDATQQNQNAYLLALKYKLNDQFTAKVNYQRYNLSAPSDPFASAAGSSASIPTYNGYQIAYLTILKSNRSTNLLSIGGDYKITPNLNLAVGYYVQNGDAYANDAYVITSSVTGFACTGSCAPSTSAKAALSMTYTSAVLDYNLSKRTDVYLGYMGTSPGGANSGYQNNSVVAAGMRTKF